MVRPVSIWLDFYRHTPDTARGAQGIGDLPDTGLADDRHDSPAHGRTRGVVEVPDGDPDGIRRVIDLEVPEFVSEVEDKSLFNIDHCISVVQIISKVAKGAIGGGWLDRKEQWGCLTPKRVVKALRVDDYSLHLVGLPEQAYFRLAEPLGISQPNWDEDPCLQPDVEEGLPLDIFLGVVQGPLYGQKVASDTCLAPHQ